METEVKDPTPNMGATILHYTDRTAATVVRVGKSGKVAWLREDMTVRTDKNGMDERQEYACFPGHGPEIRISRRKDGLWYTGKGQRVALGYRAPYHDFSF
jgi:hypothetical protein